MKHNSPPSDYLAWSYFSTPPLDLLLRTDSAVLQNSMLTHLRAGPPFQISKAATYYVNLLWIHMVVCDIPFNSITPKTQKGHKLFQKQKTRKEEIDTSFPANR
jgi:hypothetical protein